MTLRWHDAPYLIPAVYNKAQGGMHVFINEHSAEPLMAFEPQDFSNVHLVLVAIGRAFSPRVVPRPLLVFKRTMGTKGSQLQTAMAADSQFVRDAHFYMVRPLSAVVGFGINWFDKHLPRSARVIWLSHSPEPAGDPTAAMGFKANKSDPASCIRLAAHCGRKRQCQGRQSALAMEQAETVAADSIVSVHLSRHRFVNEPTCSVTTGCKQPTESVHQFLLPVSTPHVLLQPEAYMQCQSTSRNRAHGQAQPVPVAVNKLAVYGAPSEWIQASFALLYTCSALGSL
eukprot:CAMPEP_0181180594 /NCGR_PEP_ID=MMETSP1096-20121128/6884_1 /TAXON_ID=156174 ORGANISM="Chrysochromulina ericina, Strain CCMP281" /NCGR_SAMPLE_ID=MMETSP1096 /ASSEMBLY_ACC=CAM_ASM_000453 /LENGTH=284 /DNA_ID=CAMNT_0023269035 /DNA_START=478 /DNA_END=1332 /DNA_ORIENTATION=-